ncbi:hypothetical protein BS47DRAFT_1203931 [Hydnum rufescens UP504]|uniref:Uncharacterized protein n=1 Tax=Hydnum rufescens UP504 TaxID=1448309 RepID=A0A9P6ASX7_9AGAM|nr:hypothetical protein BS47DRAFT_1203931 [Hydnum rufescens UP504]
MPLFSSLILQPFFTALRRLSCSFHGKLSGMSPDVPLAQLVFSDTLVLRHFSIAWCSIRPRETDDLTLFLHSIFRLQSLSPVLPLDLWPLILREGAVLLASCLLSSAFWLSECLCYGIFSPQIEIQSKESVLRPGVRSN